MHYTLIWGIIKRCLADNVRKNAYNGPYKCRFMHEYTHIVHIVLNNALNYCISNVYDV